MDKFESAKQLFFSGLRFLEENRFQEAENNLLQSLELMPDRPSTLINLSAAQTKLRKYEAARNTASRAIELDPNACAAHLNLGLIACDENNYPQALHHFQQSLKINPNYAEAWANIGTALKKLGQHQEADLAFAKAFQINPNQELIFGKFVHSRMKLCDWTDFDIHCLRLQAQAHNSQLHVPPFFAHGLVDELPIHYAIATLYTGLYHPVDNGHRTISKHPAHSKLRIAYFSRDFRNHPVSLLMAEIFELHDRDKFEITGFYFGPDKQDEMRHRVEAAFDRFIDVRDRSDLEIAQLARELEIDIAIDLNGYTEESRTGIFAHRSAPIQVQYIGFLGTMGAPYIDYILADPVLIPEESQQYYTEKVAYLPSYQANDRKRIISERVFSRAELGLPESGFVFCCFNNNYKILPDTFSIWMRILQRVPDSVLFLYADNKEAETNLRKEAETRGVNPKRLVFAGRIPVPEYLARYRIADLFLDTFPYNAGTTASDALWAGLPVLTHMGESFASRMAASLLTAIGLPELITTSTEEYEELAVTLATHPAQLTDIKLKLQQNRLTTPLFDSPHFTKNLEAAFMAMMERYRAGLPPDHIHIGDH